jgi:hypothetical protein
MKLRTLAFSLLAAGSVVLASACTVTTTTPAIGGDPDPVTCTPEGADCGSDAECCSDSCGSDNVCVDVDNCTLDNDACDADEDCCSMICASDGFCGLP